MNHAPKQDKGFVLLGLLVMLLLLATLALTLNRRAALQVRMSANRMKSTQLYLGQNAAIEQAIWKMNKDASWRTGRYTDLKFASGQGTIDNWSCRFVVNGFEPGDEIAIVNSSPMNDGFYVIDSVTPVRIKVDRPLPLAGGIWMGQATIAALSGSKHVYGDLSFIPGVNGARDKITTSAGNFVAHGFRRGDQVVLLQSFPDNDNVYHIAEVAPTTMELDNGVLPTAGVGGGTLATLRGERFDYNGLRYSRRVMDRFSGSVGSFIAISCMAHGARAGVTDVVRLPKWRNCYLADSGNHRIRKCNAGANTISTIAGNSDPATLLKPFGVWVDAMGNILVADTQNYVTRVRLSATAAVNVIAGTGSAGFTGDGGFATAAQIKASYGVSRDAWGNVYIADTANNRIRKVWAGSDVITTVAGNGTATFAGDGGPATLASLKAPWSIHVDAVGNLAIADTDNNRVRRVDAATGIITTIAGSGSQGYAGDATAPTRAQIDKPQGVCVDGTGNIYLVDTDNDRVRKVNAEVDPETGFRLVTTVAGNGIAAYSGDDGPATDASIKKPCDLCFDADGNLYIADTDNNRVRKVDAMTRVISTVAGTGVAAYLGDNGLATNAALKALRGVFVDGAGNILIADTGNHCVRKVSAIDGKIRTVAGIGGSGGYTGDGVAATLTRLNAPAGVAVDAGTGDLYIADTGNNRVRKVSAATGTIAPVAGTGAASYGGDGGLATAAALNKPVGIDFDGVGNLFIADTGNHRVRVVGAGSGTITTVAGNGAGGYLGDGVLATSTRLNKPARIDVDAAGNLFVADMDNQRIRKVAAGTQFIGTELGNGVRGYWGDANPATQALLNKPKGVFADSAGNVYISDTGNDRIRKVLASKGIIYTIAGSGESGYAGDGGPAVDAEMDVPLGIWVDAGGDVYMADSENHRIRKISVASGIISTVAGNGSPGYTGDGEPAVNASLKTPADVAVDAWGGIIIADTENNVIRKVYPGTGKIGTIIGEVSGGYVADNVPAVDTPLNFPARVSRDAAGNFYIADSENNRVRKVDVETGIIQTVAGDGIAAYTGDGGLAVNASLNMPRGVHVDSAGHILIADTENSCVRRIDATSGIISTVAGTGDDGFTGDGGPATLARIRRPASVRSDTAGNVLIADTENSVIRRVDALSGVITTVAGIGGSSGYNGDGIPATTAKLRKPNDLWIGQKGNLFIADTGNHRIRRVDVITGFITTVAGTGSAGYSGEDGPATAAELNSPDGISLDPDGNIYVADTNNECIRKVDAATGTIRRVAGKDGEAGFSGDGGDPRSAKLNQPFGVWVDQEVSTGSGVVRP